MRGSDKKAQEKQEFNGSVDKTEKDIRIMLVDDHELVRYGLRRMLESEEDMEVVGECANAEEAVSRLAKFHPNIVLMDVEMPGKNGIEATRSLKRNGLNYDGDIIVLAETTEYKVEAMGAGAADYLLKGVTRSELTRAVRDAYWNRQSAGQRQGFVEEAMELRVLASGDAAQLLRFTCQLSEILEDSCASIAQMVGSWDCGTVITIALGYNSAANILERLSRMPDVDKVEEKPTGGNALPGAPGQFGRMSGSRVRLQDSLLVTLKQPDRAMPKLEAVLS